MDNGARTEHAPPAAGDNASLPVSAASGMSPPRKLVTGSDQQLHRGSRPRIPARPGSVAVTFGSGSLGPVYLSPGQLLPQPHHMSAERVATASELFSTRAAAADRAGSAGTAGSAGSGGTSLVNEVPSTADHSGPGSLLSSQVSATPELKKPRLSLLPTEVPRGTHSLVPSQSRAGAKEDDNVNVAVGDEDVATAAAAAIGSGAAHRDCTPPKLPAPGLQGQLQGRGPGTGARLAAARWSHLEVFKRSPLARAAFLPCEGNPLNVNHRGTQGQGIVTSIVPPQGAMAKAEARNPEGAVTALPVATHATAPPAGHQQQATTPAAKPAAAGVAASGLTATVGSGLVRIGGPRNARAQEGVIQGQVQQVSAGSGEPHSHQAVADQAHDDSDRVTVNEGQVLQVSAGIGRPPPRQAALQLEGSAAAAVADSAHNDPDMAIVNQGHLDAVRAHGVEASGLHLTDRVRNCEGCCKGLAAGEEWPLLYSTKKAQQLKQELLSLQKSFSTSLLERTRVLQEASGEIVRACMQQQGAGRRRGSSGNRDASYNRALVGPGYQGHHASGESPPAVDPSGGNSSFMSVPHSTSCRGSEPVSQVSQPVSQPGRGIESHWGRVQESVHALKESCRVLLTAALRLQQIVKGTEGHREHLKSGWRPFRAFLEDEFLPSSCKSRDLKAQWKDAADLVLSLFPVSATDQECEDEEEEKEAQANNVLLHETPSDRPGCIRRSVKRLERSWDQAFDVFQDIHERVVTWNGKKKRKAKGEP